MAGERTIPRLWRNAIAAGPPEPAYLTQHDDHWHGVSWREADQRVRDYANGLLALGVRKGDKFAILARTSLEWALVDFALAHVGAVVVPIYPNSAPRDVHYVLEHSGSVGVLCETGEHRAMLDELRPELQELAHVLAYDDLPELAARGREYTEAHPQALDEAAGAVGEDDLFTILYTSGTTGPPKGCMISHRNEHAMVSVTDELGTLTKSGDVMLLYLPLAHNFGRLMHLEGPHVGYTIAFLSDPLAVGDAIPQVRPTVFPSVPRVYEKVHAAVLSRFDEATGLRRRLIDWALAVGRRRSELDVAGKPIPRSLAAQFRLADRLVYGKVKERLGGRLRTAISGGAPLAQEIGEFFDALGIRILEGYGLTECTCAATVNRPDRCRFGTVGLPFPGFELRVADDGELLMRSATVFQGYYKDAGATAAVLTPDGWLKTGDIAEIDADGFVRITDRKKDIIVTAGGKNIAPQNLENDLKTSRYVSQALVVGDRKPYPSALITLDPVEIRKWAQEQGIDATDVADLAGHPRVRELVQAIVDKVNGDRSRFEQIKRFEILPRDFTMEDGEVTPTLKLKRRVVEEHFAEEIERLYAGEDAKAPVALEPRD